MRATEFIVIGSPLIGGKNESVYLKTYSRGPVFFFFCPLISEIVLPCLLGRERKPSQSDRPRFFIPDNFYLTFFFFSEYQTVAGGRSRLHLIDLGNSERGKASGGIPLSGVGNILLAIFNGQKHLPYKEHKLTHLLKGHTMQLFNDLHD